MKFISSFFLLLISTITLAQTTTTVYLRSSGPQSVPISGIANGTPPTITTQYPHGYSGGETISVVGACTGVAVDPASGQSPINGIRTVCSSPIPGQNTFSLCTQDSSSTPIVGNGNLVSCMADGSLDNAVAKWVGKLTPFKLGPGPLGWFDGLNGPIFRKVALSTNNGLISLVVTNGNLATVTTSYLNGMSTGDKLAISGAGINNASQIALDTCNGVGPHCPYSVTVLDATHFTFPVSGVVSGTYSGINMACGPSVIPDNTIGGKQDCLTLSQLAYTGNPAWDSLMSNAMDLTNYKFIADGGPQFNGSGDFTFAEKYGLSGLKLVVDPTDSDSLTILLYFMNNVEKINGVNWTGSTTDQSGGNTQFSGYTGEIWAGLAIPSALATPFMSDSSIKTFNAKIYNDVSDPTNVFSTFNADEAYDNHRKVLDAGLAIAGSSNTITLALTASSVDNFYVNNIIQIAPTSGPIQYANYISGITAVGFKGQSCILNEFNGGGSGAIGALTLTDTNSIASGTHIVMSNPGFSFQSTPTTANVASGMATCSGIPVLTSGIGTAFYFGTVTAYNASTNVATVSSNWPINPNPGTAYKVYATISQSTPGTNTAIVGYNTQFQTDSNPGLRVNSGDALLCGNFWIYASNSYYEGQSEAFVNGVTSDSSAIALDNASLITTASPCIMWVAKAWKPGDVGLIWLVKNWLASTGATPVLYPAQGGSQTSYPYGPTDSGNNSVAYSFGRAAMGFVMAPYDSRAIYDLALAQGYGFDYIIRPYMNYTAGSVHSGAGYSFAVVMGLGHLVSIIRASVPGFPSMDEQGPWLTQPALFDLYNMLPDLKSWTSNGYSTLAYPSPFGALSTASDLAAGVSYTSYHLFNPAFYLNPNSPYPQYLSWFLHNGASYDMLTNHANLNENYQDVKFLLRLDPRLKSIDYRSFLPLQYSFTSSSATACATLTGWPCPINYRGDVMISLTGWTSQSSMSSRASTFVFYRTSTWANDHDVPENGSLRVCKVGCLLGVDSPNNYVSTGQPDEETQMGDMLQFGGSGANAGGNPSVKAGSASTVAAYGESPTIRWASSNHGSFAPNFGDKASKYVYECSDLSGVYTTLMNYAQRCVIHLKDLTLNNNTGEEIIMQWDTVDVTGNPTAIATHLHYHQNLEPQYSPSQPYNYNEGDTICIGGCNTGIIRSLESGEPQDADPARQYGITTKILSPGIITVQDDNPVIHIVSVSNSTNPIFTCIVDCGIIQGQQITIVNPSLISPWIVLNTPIQTPVTPTVIDSTHFTISFASSVGIPIPFDGIVHQAYMGGKQFGIVSITAGNPTIIQTDLPYGVSAGNIVSIVAAPGDWAPLNRTDYGYSVGSIDATHFTIPFDSTGFSGSITGTIGLFSTAQFNSFGQTHRFSICGGPSCGSSVNTFEQLTIHKVMKTLTDINFNYLPINPDNNWFGVQTNDKVVILARWGITHSMMRGFTTTHAGIAQYLFGGLTPGLYTITINGVPVVGSPFVVAAGDNSLEFESTAGIVSVNGS